TVAHPSRLAVSSHPSCAAPTHGISPRETLVTALTRSPTESVSATSSRRAVPGRHEKNPRIAARERHQCGECRGESWTHGGSGEDRIRLRQPQNLVDLTLVHVRPARDHVVQ